MRASSAFSKRPLDARKRPLSCKSDRIAWSPIIIESISTTSYVGKGAILDIEKDVEDDKISLESRNLFHTLSLPHDLINNLNYSNNYISKIEKIESLKQLQYLDFSDNHLVEISGLPEGLKVLLLGRNRIKRISGLDSLVNLDILDLSSNLIEEIEGLEKLQNLRILNLESNKISKLPDICCMLSLVELNLKKNQIKDISPLSINALKRLMLGYNQLRDLQVVYNFLNCNQLLELYMEGNPISIDPSYRTFIVVRVKQLKFLDGKRITEEERRTCVKLEKRASEKRMEVEKLLQRDNKKKSILENIEREWDWGKTEMFIYPSSSQSKKCNSKTCAALKRSATTSQVYDGGFYQISNGYLELFGNALAALENQDPAGISSISFNMIHIEDILRFYPVLARYRYLMKISFNRTMIEYLPQFNLFKSFDIHDVSISNDDNPITCVKITKNYLIYTFKNLLTFQGKPITESERNQAWAQFAPLRQVISQISPRLLTKNQAKYLPFSHVPLKKKQFAGLESDNESVDSDAEGNITSVNERLSAGILISCALKQKRITEEFDVVWKEMIDDVLVNHH